MGSGDPSCNDLFRAVLFDRRAESGRCIHGEFAEERSLSGSSDNATRGTSKACLTFHSGLFNVALDSGMSILCRAFCRSFAFGLSTNLPDPPFVSSTPGCASSRSGLSPTRAAIPQPTLRGSARGRSATTSSSSWRTVIGAWWPASLPGGAAAAWTCCPCARTPTSSCPKRTRASGRRSHWRGAGRRTWYAWRARSV